MPRRPLCSHPNPNQVMVLKSAANVDNDEHTKIFNSKDFHANERGCEMKWKVLDKAKPVIYDSSTDKPAQICEKVRHNPLTRTHTQHTHTHTHTSMRNTGSTHIRLNSTFSPNRNPDSP